MSIDLGRLTCSTITFRRYSLPEALEGIRAAGMTSVDIGTLPGFCDHFNMFEADEEEEEAFVRLVQTSGLSVHAFTAHVGHFNLPNVDTDAGRRAASRNLRLAKRLGAYGVNVNCGAFRDRAQFPLAADMAVMANHIRLFSEEAAELGLALMIEAPHKGNLIRTADEAVELVQAVNHPNCGLIFDCNHHHAAGWSMPDAVRRVGHLIRLVHLRDAVKRDNIYPLGTGEIDFAAMFAALDEIGYEGRYSLEFTDAADTLEGNVHKVRESLEYLKCL